MSEKSKHIILGAGGSIGNVLTDELLSRGEPVKWVSRKGHKIPGVDAEGGDIIDLDFVNGVIEESSTVYLLVGLQYNIAIWRAKWPKIMNNVIDACKYKGAKLIFFDNVYMYGHVDGPMTEETPVKPSSEKGKLRAQIADKLLSEIETGKLTAMIARAADFYGPHAEKTSLPYIFYFSRLAAGKRAQVLVNPDKVHSYTYTGDCGKALSLLASDNNAFGQVWHLPTASPPMTSREFVALVAEKLGADNRFTVLRKWMARLAGLFDKQAKEVFEMLYQNEFDYVFSSAKFEKYFGFTPTTYETGIEKTIEFYRDKLGLNSFQSN